MEEDNKTYCKYAFNSMHWDVNGRTAPCCTFRGSNTPINLSISEYWNSKWLAEVRRKMIAGEKVEGCNRCYEEERMGGTSMRERKSGPSIYNIQELNPVLERIHITYSNLCNKTCNICRPYRSHLIGREYQKIIDADPNNIWMKHKREDQPYTDLTLNTIKFDGLDDEKISDIKNHIISLKRIDLTGGEPFIHMEYINKLLKILIESNRQDIKIVVATNGSWTKEILDRFLQFTDVQFNISVDGINNLYDLVRSPHTWEWFVEKINLLNEYPNIRQRYEAVINVFNVHQLADIVKYFSPNPVGLSMLVNQEYLGAWVCPDHILEKAGNELRELGDYRLKKTGNYLLRCMHKNVEKDNMLFHEFIKTMEPIKKLKYQDYIPWSFDLVK